MNEAAHFIPALALASFLLAGCQHSEAHSPAADRASLDAAKQAFFASWTKGPADTFKLDKVAATVDKTSDFLSFDAMSKDKTVISGYDAYAAIWEPGMNAFKSAQLSEAKAERTWISGDLAVTASIAHISGELPDGTKLDMPGHLTLAWKRDGASWRAVHEHMSLGVKE
jgi:ketosteroid isomerase-like protein